MLSSRALAAHTVQVSTEAASRPTITPFTTGDASKNMPVNVRSWGSVDAGVASPLDGSGAASGPAAALGATTGAADGVTEGEVCGGEAASIVVVSGGFATSAFAGPC
jgi:hypothetical protein